MRVILNPEFLFAANYGSGILATDGGRHQFDKEQRGRLSEVAQGTAGILPVDIDLLKVGALLPPLRPPSGRNRSLMKSGKHGPRRGT